MAIATCMGMNSLTKGDEMDSTYLHLHRAPKGYGPGNWELIHSRSMDLSDTVAILDTWYFETKQEARRYAKMVNSSTGSYPYNF